MSVAALSVAGGALGVVVASPMLGYSASSALACAASTTFLLAAALTLSLRAKGHVGAKTLLWCFVFGWLNAPSTVLLLMLIDPQPQAGAMVVGALILGIVFGGVPGLLYGAFAAVATTSLRRLVDRPSLTSRVDAQATVGALVFVASALAYASVVLGYASRVSSLVPLGVVVFGGVYMLQALARRWLLTRLARAPAAHGYERVALADLGIDAEGLWRLHTLVPDDAKHVLVRRAPESGDGAYRVSAPRVPLALVE